MRFLIVLLLLSLFNFKGFTQNDTIHVKTGIVLYGEIKGIKSGVLTMETAYSDKDFTIDFSQITELKIEKICFIVLAGGRRLSGYVRSEKANEFTFTDKNGTKETIPIQDLVLLEEINSKFWKRISGNIDFSYNLTKANNASQFTIGGGLSYRGTKWVGKANITALNSDQDNVDQITRNDINAELLRVLPRNWYLLTNYSFLSNTEQALESRNSLRAGAGRFLVLSNKLSWGLNIGLNYNIENFNDLTPDNQSTELYFGSDFDMFDYTDWKLKTNINIFPSLSETGRWRVDYNLDLKWDLPYDFYIKTNLQFNYDNRAASSGSDFDYIWTTGIGWSFN